MKNEYYTINVLIVTYKQEKLIGRALESILCQRKYGLKKIIVCDDCSPDDNWAIIQRYTALYPDVIEPHRNDVNLGIYGNLERLVSLKGEADLYYIMAGDDALCEGWFKSVQSFLLENEVDISAQAACIYSDWKMILPSSNSEYIHRQNKVLLKGVDLRSLRIRQIVNCRSMLQTKAVLDRYTPIDLEHGVPLSEKMFDIQSVLHSDYNYYCPFVGSIYYACVGVSTRASDPQYREEIIYANKKWLVLYNWSLKDRNRIKYNIAVQEFHLSPSFIKYIRMQKLFFFSIDLKIGFSLRSFLRGFILH